MSVELQIRSKIQHSWATAVEVVGTFTKQALKASAGDSIWLEFFQYASIEFAKLEGSIIDPNYVDLDTFSEMDSRYKELELSNRLKAFKVAATALSDKKERGAGYFVVLLDLDAKRVNFNPLWKTAALRSDIIL